MLFVLFVLFVYDILLVLFFFFKQKTAFVMRISDCSSDVCSSDLRNIGQVRARALHHRGMRRCFATGCCENQERGAQASQPAVLRCGPHGRAHHFEVIFRRSTLPEAGTSQLSWPEKPAMGMFSLPSPSPAALSWPAAGRKSPSLNSS